MNYRKPTIEIFRSLVESMTFPVKIRAIVTNGDGDFVLYVCDIYHAQPTFHVTINSIEYTIVDIDSNDRTITVSGSEIPIVTTFELYKPYFIYGTPIQTGMELNKESEVNIPHVPMVFFPVQFEDVDHTDIDPINKSITGDLYCLTQGDNFQWLNEQAFAWGVMPMRRLAENIVAKMIESISIFNILPAEQSFKIKDFPKFGVFISQKGVQKSMWSDQLSGCCIRVESLGIWDDGKCDDC